MQPALLFPAEVYHAARAAGLGNPIQEYNDGDQPVQEKESLFTSRKLTSFLEWLLFWSMFPLVVAVLLGCIGLGFVAVLLNVFFPLNLAIDATLLLASLLFVPLLLVNIFDAMWPVYKIDRAVSRAWSCPDGFVYQQGKHFHAIRWEQLATVTRQTARVGNYQTISYRVQPDGAPAFAFTLLTPAYTRWIKPHRRSGGMRRFQRGPFKSNSTGTGAS